MKNLPDFSHKLWLDDFIFKTQGPKKEIVEGMPSTAPEIHLKEKKGLEKVLKSGELWQIYAALGRPFFKEKGQIQRKNDWQNWQIEGKFGRTAADNKKVIKYIKEHQEELLAEKLKTRGKEKIVEEVRKELGLPKIEKKVEKKDLTFQFLTGLRRFSLPDFGKLLDENPLEIGTDLAYRVLLSQEPTTKQYELYFCLNPKSGALRLLDPEKKVVKAFFSFDVLESKDFPKILKELIDQFEIKEREAYRNQDLAVQLLNKLSERWKGKTYCVQPASLTFGIETVRIIGPDGQIIAWVTYNPKSRDQRGKPTGPSYIAHNFFGGDPGSKFRYQASNLDELISNLDHHRPSA